MTALLPYSLIVLTLLCPEGAVEGVEITEHQFHYLALFTRHIIVWLSFKA